MARSDATADISVQDLIPQTVTTGVQNQLAGYFHRILVLCQVVRLSLWLLKHLKCAIPHSKLQRLLNGYLARLHKYYHPDNVAWLIKH